jgi:hypothetical protein
LFADIRKGITQAEYTGWASKIVTFEIFVISSILGIWLQSWTAFWLSFFGLFVALQFKTLGIIITILLSLVWGAMFFFFGGPIGCIVGFIIGFGIHKGMSTYLSDLSS